MINDRTFSVIKSPLCKRIYNGRSVWGHSFNEWYNYLEYNNPRIAHYHALGRAIRQTGKLFYDIP